ncbi:MAG: MarR family winged helix-turn-helix transcriptional regulator, partial [Tepidiformaceae bacterium]
SVTYRAKQYGGDGVMSTPHPHDPRPEDPQPRGTDEYRASMAERMRELHGSTAGNAPFSDEIAALVRELHLSSTHNALFSDAIAQRLGINSTDMECVDLLHLFGPMTPSQMSQLTGLTTGAITRLVDRLEKGGWVRRVPDLRDRRRITVEPLHETRSSPAWHYFKGMAMRMAQLIGKYTPEQLTLLTDFTRRSNEILHDETVRLRSAEADAPQEP